uniref:Uncharacterized protein n=1 Tax=viral metagenome TaxID=1070528 RepID=A0A6C0I9H8_9ZZZZ
MVFYYLVDLVTSISLNIIVKCSTWIIYQSANGVYYLYKKIKPDSMIENVPTIPKLINNDDFVIITREEYNKLINSQQNTSIDTNIV